MTNSFFLVCFSICVAAVAAEYCSRDADCQYESCPHGYVVKCLPENVCSCAHAGECSTSADCESNHHRCENNDKHWYCNYNKCCCGEPCPHAQDRVYCNTPEDCSAAFFRCTNNDKTWHCTSDHHCHCGSDHGGIKS